MIKIAKENNIPVEDCYIVTSDKTEAKSPYNFNDKVKIISGIFGVPEGNIVQDERPYNATKVLDKYNKDNDIAVYFVGIDDVETRFSNFKPRKDGSPQFFQPLKDYVQENKDSFIKRSYVVEIPDDTRKLDDVPENLNEYFSDGEISGTSVRNALKNVTSDLKKDLFIFLFGKYDKTLDKLISSKLV